MKRLGWPIFLLVGIVAGFLWLVLIHDPAVRRAAHDKAAIDSARAVLETGDIYRQSLARLQATQDSLARDTARLSANVAKWRRLASQKPPKAIQSGPVDSLAGDLGLAPIPGGYLADSSQVRAFADWGWQVHIRIPAMEALLAVTDSLLHDNRELVFRLSERAALSEARVTQLETVTSNLLKVKDCRILGLFSCPTRGTAFVVGGITGAVITAVILK